ncbi:MAG: DHA2 family efflux MFS transporter permease subunit [Candidatus Dormibacteria bacterium]
MTQTNPAPDGAATASTERRRWIALYVLCAGMLMIALDVTIVNVALPSIQTDLGFSSANLAWLVNAYLIAFGGFLLLAGRVGDLWGHRRLFLAGLAVFTTASLACGLADSQGLLVAGRFVQGIGGAMTSAVILGMIVRMFPEPAGQAKAMGVFGFVASGGGSIGLLAGGVLTQSISWHWIFFVNVPIGLVTAALALRYVEGGAGIGLRRGADGLGAILVTGALMLAVYTIVGPAAEDGWGSARVLRFVTITAVLFAAFLAREATARQPLIPLRIFRSRDLAGGNAIQGLVVAGMFGNFFLGALYLQRVLGYSPLQIGFAFLPTTLVMGTMSLRFADRLTMRFGPRRTLLGGLSLAALGLVLFAQAPVDGRYVVNVLPMMLLLALGIGGCFPALLMSAMGGVAPEDAGLASGLVNTTAQVGGALGLAVLATVSATRSAGLLRAGRTPADALVSGYHLAFLLAAALLLVAIGVVAFVLTPPAGSAARPEMERIAELDGVA